MNVLTFKLTTRLMRCNRFHFIKQSSFFTSYFVWSLHHFSSTGWIFFMSFQMFSVAINLSIFNCCFSAWNSLGCLFQANALITLTLKGVFWESHVLLWLNTRTQFFFVQRSTVELAAVWGCGRVKDGWILYFIEEKQLQECRSLFVLELKKRRLNYWKLKGGRKSLQNSRYSQTKK